jgi:hypothetical protein
MRTNQKNPPLAFGAREGVAVVEVDKNETEQPSTRVCSEGGCGGGGRQ